MERRARRERIKFNKLTDEEKQRRKARGDVKVNDYQQIYFEG
jgi:hypothetical protein